MSLSDSREGISSSFTPADEGIDLTANDNVIKRNFSPPDAHGWNTRFNFDGMLLYQPSQDEQAHSYCQLFRQGQVESVLSWITGPYHDKIVLGYKIIQKSAIEALSRYLRGYQQLLINPPIIVFLVLVNVKGVELVRVNEVFPRDPAPIDRDVLFLPEILIDEFEVDVHKALKPAFDAMWNACGYSHCFDFDKDGNYDPQR